LQRVTATIEETRHVCSGTKLAIQRAGLLPLTIPAIQAVKRALGGGCAMKLPRALRAAAVAALALSLAAPTVVLADHGTDSVRAHGRLFLVLDVDLSARSESTGIGATGRASFTDTSPDPDATYRGEVTCLRVVGGSASVPSSTFYAVARITDQPPGGIAQSIHIFGTDSGKFSQAPDTLEAFPSPSPPNPDGTCPTVFPFPNRPLFDGEVVVHNTLP
jgi:hypothetical protein